MLSGWPSEAKERRRIRPRDDPERVHETLLAGGTESSRHIVVPGRSTDSLRVQHEAGKGVARDMLTARRAGLSNNSCARRACVLDIIIARVVALAKTIWDAR